jgi:hypothetical protein
MQKDDILRILCTFTHGTKDTPNIVSDSVPELGNKNYVVEKWLNDYKSFALTEHTLQNVLEDKRNTLL